MSVRRIFPILIGLLIISILISSVIVWLFYWEGLTVVQLLLNAPLYLQHLERSREMRTVPEIKPAQVRLLGSADEKTDGVWDCPISEYNPDPSSYECHYSHRLDLTIQLADEREMNLLTKSCYLSVRSKRITHIQVFPIAKSQNYNKTLQACRDLLISTFSEYQTEFEQAFHMLAMDRRPSTFQSQRARMIIPEQHFSVLINFTSHSPYTKDPADSITYYSYSLDISGVPDFKDPVIPLTGQGVILMRSGVPPERILYD